MSLRSEMASSCRVKDRRSLRNAQRDRRLAAIVVAIAYNLSHREVVDEGDDAESQQVDQ